ncbi:MAG: FecR family protein [Actinomycetota bacterium]|nr:FecR family protein [Actinomycetota bacterium]
MGSKTTLISRAAVTRSSRVAVGLVLALFAGTACWPFSDDSELAEMTVQRREGRVLILRGAETIEVEDETSLKPRDVVQTQSSGEAVVRLEGDRLLTLASDSKIRIKDVRTVESQSGSVLADTGEALEVQFGSVTASSSSGTIRIDRGVSATRVASYRGSVTVGAPGEERLQLRTLFEAVPSANAVPRVPAPYDIDSTDPWDRHYLEDVVELQEELDQLTGGLRAQIGKQRPGLGYFSTLAGGQDVGFLRPYLKRAPVNLLVGFTIASHDEDRPLGAAFREAFSLYERGAKWAVAAAIMDVKLNAVVADLEDIATVAVASSSAGDSFTLASAALSNAGEVPPPPGEGDPGLPPTQAPPTDGGGTQPPKPTDQPQPSECPNYAQCTINEAVGGVSPSSSPTPKPTDPPDDPPDDEDPLDILGGIGGP